MPQRRSVERFEADVAALRALVDTGSPRVVRGPLGGGAVSGRRREHPLPSVGHRSGKIVVVGYLLGERGGVSALIVQCDCGRPEYTVDVFNFKAFRATRCNLCALQSTHTQRKLYWSYAADMADDAHRQRLLNRLSSAIARCHNPRNAMFEHYGKRGIAVCQQWRDDRGAFLRYVQSISGWDNAALELDRIDVDCGYEPGNVRFVSRSENMLNRRHVADLEDRIRVLERENRELRARLAGL